MENNLALAMVTIQASCTAAAPTSLRNLRGQPIDIFWQVQVEMVRWINASVWFSTVSFRVTCWRGFDWLPACSHRCTHAQIRFDDSFLFRFNPFQITGFTHVYCCLCWLVMHYHFIPREQAHMGIVQRRSIFFGIVEIMKKALIRSNSQFFLDNVAETEEDYMDIEWMIWRRKQCRIHLFVICTKC